MKFLDYTVDSFWESSTGLARFTIRIHKRLKIDQQMYSLLGCVTSMAPIPTTNLIVFITESLTLKNGVSPHGSLIINPLQGSLPATVKIEDVPIKSIAEHMAALDTIEATLNDFSTKLKAAALQTGMSLQIDSVVAPIVAPALINFKIEDLGTTMVGVVPTQGKQCECGSQKVGSSIHSAWCPKYNSTEGSST